MGYHSSDYNHDWKIDGAELTRTIVLFNTIYAVDGIRSGCYKVDPLTVDGFAQDTARDPSVAVTLSQYHSADYNQDGRIDQTELDRVTFLYNTRVLGARTGSYHVDSSTIDGFDRYAYPYKVELSSYNFREDQPPIISSQANLYAEDGKTYYKLRCKFLDGSVDGLMGTEEDNNNNRALTTLPPPGTYNVELYYVQYSYGGFEGDYDNDGEVTDADVTAISEIVSEILPQPTGSQFMRADCAPRSTLGEGTPIDIGDFIQVGRYRFGYDQTVPVGGPGTPDADPALIGLIGIKTFATVTITEVLTEQGQCSPAKLEVNCNAPALPLAPCPGETFTTTYNPDAVKKFSVTANLKDQDCFDILDNNDKVILTVIQ